MAEQVEQRETLAIRVATVIQALLVMAALAPMLVAMVEPAEQLAARVVAVLRLSPVAQVAMVAPVEMAPMQVTLVQPEVLLLRAQ
jgi:hypothetical protein